MKAEWLGWEMNGEDEKGWMGGCYISATGGKQGGMLVSDFGIHKLPMFQQKMGQCHHKIDGWKVA